MTHDFGRIGSVILEHVILHYTEVYLLQILVTKR